MTKSQQTYVVPTVRGPIRFDIRVPGSKSITNRALLLGALAEGRSEIEGVLFSNDSHHFIGCLRELGVRLEVDESRHFVQIAGVGGRLPRREATIDVGSAGTAARFLTGVLALSPGEYTVHASEQMQKRPMAPLMDALEQAGAHFEFLGTPGHLPYRVRAAERPPAKIEIDSTASSQFLSALLLVCPLVGRSVEIHPLGPVPTPSYIEMTLRMMRSFGVELTRRGDVFVSDGTGYTGQAYTVEPDISSACYFAGAAAITGGRVLLRDVHQETLQGDISFLHILEQMGCTLRESADGLDVSGPVGGRLKGITIDMNDCPDQVPTLAALAPFADGPVEIRNVEQVRHHECDRLAAVAKELTRMGIECEEYQAGILIRPGAPQPCTVETYDDHRMAMAFALTGLRAEGIRIANPSCTSKTFPTYFSIFDQMVSEPSAT